MGYRRYEKRKYQVKGKEERQELDDNQILKERGRKRERMRRSKSSRRK
jgi:hypothetical protein